MEKIKIELTKQEFEDLFEMLEFESGEWELWKLLEKFEEIKKTIDK